jgi:hypothetical protein
MLPTKMATCQEETSLEFNDHRCSTVWLARNIKLFDSIQIPVDVGCGSVPGHGLFVVVQSEE